MKPEEVEVLLNALPVKRPAADLRERFLQAAEAGSPRRAVPGPWGRLGVVAALAMFAVTVAVIVRTPDATTPVAPPQEEKIPDLKVEGDPPERAGLRELMTWLERQAAVFESKLEASEKKESTVDVALSRQYGHEMFEGDPAIYGSACFSFEHDTHDPKKTRNDWDIQFGNGGDTFHVNMATDDRSLLWDLGPRGFHGIGTVEGPGSASVAARKGSAFVVHTFDTETNLWSVLQVLDLMPGQWIIFRWRVIADSAPFEKALEKLSPAIRSGTVRLQLRGGAGGGNPNQAFVDGSVNGYVRRIATQPLDLALPISTREPHEAYIEGAGRIPRGKVWIVREIAYSGSTQGDNNGNGGFVLNVGGGKIATIEQSAEPFSKVWKGRLVLRPGQELRSYAEVANSSQCDVRIKGVVWDEKYADPEKVPPSTVDERKLAISLVGDAWDPELPGRHEEVTRKLIDLGPPAISLLKSVKRDGQPDGFKEWVEKVLRELEGQ